MDIQELQLNLDSIKSAIERADFQIDNLLASKKVIEEQVRDIAFYKAQLCTLSGSIKKSMELIKNV